MALKAMDLAYPPYRPSNARLWNCLYCNTEASVLCPRMSHRLMQLMDEHWGKRYSGCPENCIPLCYQILELARIAYTVLSCLHILGTRTLLQMNESQQRICTCHFGSILLDNFQMHEFQQRISYRHLDQYFSKLHNFRSNQMGQMVFDGILVYDG